jgi:hypothetical protein
MSTRLTLARTGARPRVTGFRAVGVERMIRDGGIKEATTIAALGLLWLKGLL